MKFFVSVLLAAGICSAATYFVVSQQKDAAVKAERARLEAEWKAEKEKLEAELAAEKNKSPLIEQVKTEVAVTARRSPEEILQKLLTLKPAGPSRISVIRKIVHQLEELTDIGTNSVPAIRKFLAQNQDIDYSTPEGRDENNDRDRRWTPPWQRSSPPTEFTLPPSLRIGLFDVLKEIEGEDAELALAEVLKSSGRAVEVAYIARALEARAPGKYREMALNAAKDLLMNPLPIDNPNRLDEQAEGYLYGILEMYNDASFVDAARALLVSEGKLNRNAQNYLAKTQGDQVVSVLYDAFKNKGLSNTWDRISVANRILDYVGPNMEANNFLNEIVTNADLDSRMRSFAVMRLAGGFGRDEMTVDAQSAKDRLPVVQALKPGVTDERVLQAIDRTERNLNNIIDGKPVEWGFGGRGSGGNGQPGPPQSNQSQ